MIIEVENDLFKAHPKRAIICQQVNCKGVMGAGLEKAIRDKFPIVYEQYRAEYELGVLELGYTSYIEVKPDLFIANICGQDGYGRDKQHTDYNALEKGLKDVRKMADILGFPVVIPHGIGCGPAGGDWKIVLKMIEKIFEGDIYTYIYKYKGDEDKSGKEEKKTKSKQANNIYLSQLSVSDEESEFPEF